MDFSLIYRFDPIVQSFVYIKLYKNKLQLKKPIMHLFKNIFRISQCRTFSTGIVGINTSGSREESEELEICKEATINYKKSMRSISERKNSLKKI